MAFFAVWLFGAKCAASDFTKYYANAHPEQISIKIFISGTPHSAPTKAKPLPRWFHVPEGMKPFRIQWSGKSEQKRSFAIHHALRLVRCALRVEPCASNRMSEQSENQSESEEPHAKYRARIRARAKSRMPNTERESERERRAACRKPQAACYSQHRLHFQNQIIGQIGSPVKIVKLVVNRKVAADAAFTHILHHMG